jgi:large subunit ribosomal protein L3
MSPGILGKKIGMTQIFRADGQVVPVTLVKAGPCVVVQRKTPATDGYDAVQLGLLEAKKTVANKAMAGHLGADNVFKADKNSKTKTNVKFIKELRLEGGNSELKKGDRVLAEHFKANDVVDVIGTSKGRGFASLVKRHHFRGGPSTHGSMFNRAAGSIGASSFPSRVFPGMRMAGQMGVQQVTVRNLQIVQVDAESNVLMVKGAIPGPNGGYVVVKPAKKGGQ